MLGLVLVQHLDRNVPEASGMYVPLVYGHPGAGSNRENPLQAGDARLNPFGGLNHLNGRAVGSRWDAVERQKGLVLTGEYEAATVEGEVDRCISDSVPGEEQPPARPIPERNRKLTRDLLECVHSPAREKLQHQEGVRCS